MIDPRQQMKSLMKRVRQQGMLPSSGIIVNETFERLGYVRGAVEADEVIERFNEMLWNVWKETLVTLESYEEASYARGIPHHFALTFPDSFERAEQEAAARGFREGFSQLFYELYPRFRDAFLSVSQSRKTRGGKDFELQIERLLDFAGIPYHRQETEHRTDLILPDLETHRTNRNISAIVSIKRTLRERWAEVAEELFNLRSPNVFLFTADESVTQNHVNRICDQYNIHLVVWDKVKSLKHPDRPLVLGYTDWAGSRLAVLRQYWDQETV
jgi:hypothetical protein